MSADIMKIVMFFFVGALVVLVVTHPKGFSTSAGSVFSGVTGMGNVLTGQGIKGAS